MKIPYDSGIHLKTNQKNPIAQLEYDKIMGNVMLLMNYPRLDIAYGVSQLCGYIHNPNQEHFNALTH